MENARQGLSRSPTRNLRFVKGEWFVIGRRPIRISGTISSFMKPTQSARLQMSGR